MNGYDYYLKSVWDQTLNLIKTNGIVNEQVLDMFSTGSKLSTIEDSVAKIQTNNYLTFSIMDKYKGDIELCLQSILEDNDIKCAVLNTEEEKKHKEFVMESCLLDASLVPLQIMDLSYQSLKLFSTLNEKGSVMAISDVGVGVQCLRSALTGAIMNVYINTKSMKNREMAEKMNRRAEKLLVEGQQLADQITNSVIKKLGGTSC